MFNCKKYCDYLNRTLRHILIIVLVVMPLNVCAQNSLLEQTITLPTIFQGNSDSLITIISQTASLSISYSNRVYLPSYVKLTYRTATLRQFLSDIFSRFPIEFIERNQKIIIAPCKAHYYKISGFCRDAQTGESLIGANVYDTLLYVGQSSNDYGFYSINLPEGKAMVRVSYVGYRTQTHQINLKSDTMIVFKLVPSIVMKDIDVIADKSEMEQSALSIVDMPIEQVRSMPSLLGEADVIKALQLTPGVQSGEEGYGGMSVRGGGTDQNMVLLDDVPLYSPSHLMGLYSIFNIESVNSAMLVKGGFPSRYGGRLSSVLDVKTKEGNMQRYGGLLNVGLFASNAMFEGPIIKDKMSFTISARRTYFDLFSSQLQREKNHKYSFYFYDIAAKLNYIASQRDRLYLSFFCGYDNLNYGYNYHDIEVKYGDMESRTITTNDEQTVKWGNLIASTRWNHIYGNSLFSNFVISYSRYRFRNELAMQTESDYEFEHRYYSGVNDVGARLDFNWYTPFIPGSMRFGANITYHAFYPSFSAYNTSKNNSITRDWKKSQSNENSFYRLEYHAYFEDEFTVGKFSANMGAHISVLDRNSDNPYIRVEPRVSLSYDYIKNLRFKFGFCDMTQFMRQMRMTSVASPSDIWLPISSKLPPPRARQYNFETEYKFDKSLSILLETYYKRYINQQTYTNTPILSSFDKNQWNDLFTDGKGYAYGIELFLHRKSGRLSGWLSYAWAVSRNKFADINGGKYYPSDNDRTHTIALYSVYKLTDIFDFSATWTYNTGSPVTISNSRYSMMGDVNINQPMLAIEGERNAYRMPASHSLNLGANIHRVHERTTTTLSFGVYNVYAQKNPMFVYWNKHDNGAEEYKLKQFSLIAWPWPYIRYSIKF